MEETNTEEIATEDNDARDQSENLSKIELANAAAERLEKANEVKRKLIEREEALAADRLLDGETVGAQNKPKPLSEDEKWAIEAKKRYEGTGLDPTE